MEDKEKSLPAIPEEREIVAQKGTVCPNCQVVFNREKVFCPKCGLKAGDEAYLPTDTFISPVERGVAARGAGILPLVSLFLGIFGPLVLGIGWIGAIVLGFMSLSIIRRRGGFARDRRMALWGIGLGFFWPAAISLALLLFSYRLVIQRNISANEASAINQLRNIAVTQRFVKSAFLFDRDGDGESEYAGLSDLAKAGFPYFDPKLASGEKRGYLFRIDRATEEGFLAQAIPSIYGMTGRRTFYIDDIGILRGGDIGGKGILEAEVILPKIFPRPIFEEFDDEIAGDLLQEAKRQARERHFQKAKKILEEIRNNYYLSPASKEVDSVIESITIYMAEDMSKEDYQMAKLLVGEGSYRQALSKLRAIERQFPKSSIIPEVKTKILKVEKRLAESLEEEAKELFARGQSFELEGRYEEALKNYKKIAEELSSTSYFEKVKPLIQRAMKRIEEGRAEALFARLKPLNPEKDWNEILRIISLLQTSYGKTDLVKNQKSRLALLQSKSTGQKYKKKALDEFREGHYQIAIQFIEEALKADATLNEELRKPLQVSHLRLGDSYFSSHNYEKAIAHYEHYLRLEPGGVELDYDKYWEAYYQLGSLEYSRGNLGKAKEHLLKVREHFRKRPQLHYFLGSISAKEKNYQEAIGHLQAALRLDQGNKKFLRKIGLCQLAIALRLEEQLFKLLEEGQSFKRGRDFLDAAADMVNGMKAKAVELELRARPRILPGRRELTPEQIRVKRLAPMERKRYLAQERKKSHKLEDNLRKNRSNRVEIVSKMEKIYEKMVEAKRNLRQSGGRGDHLLERIISLSRRKAKLFGQGKEKLELGLSQECFIERRAFSALEESLNAFESRRSISVSEIERIYNSISMAQSRDNLETGEKLLRKAGEIKIPVEVYLSTLD